MDISDQRHPSDIPAAQDNSTADPRLSAAEADEPTTLHWAALLTGCTGLGNESEQQAKQRLLEWLSRSAEEIEKNAASLPAAFQTTRLSNELRAIEGPLRILKTVLYSLGSGTIRLKEAVDHCGRSFGWDEAKFSKWKQGVENLAGLAQWIPSFIQAEEYISAAFPLGRENLDGMRERLLESIDEPHRFLDAQVRKDFDERFLDYKKSYMDSYFLLHEDALHVVGDFRKDEFKVDPVALRNLDLLSGLQHTDKSYLNRVKLLAKWIQHNRCNLPLPQILENYPRCYCNFNPCSNQQPASAAVEVNGVIQEGLNYFRTILRGCSRLIMTELRSQAADESIQKQIAAALGEGPLLPLKSEAINTLNRIIVQHPSEFLTEIRKAAKKQE